MNRPAALIVCLVLAAVMAFAASRTPAPRAPSGDQFSAQRAMSDVRAIGSRPHPIGSSEHDRVRDYLVGRFRSLGLQTTVWTGKAFERLEAKNGVAFIEGGAAQDIIAVLPGASRDLPAIAVMAHYDTVPASPGAADDSVGVAAALEIARLLSAAKHPPGRDVVFLITDGEEAGLLGARAFFADNPMARRFGAVLNMESRGGGGRAYMFETGRDSGPMVGMFARVTDNPTASSLSSFVYSHMDNDTDFTVSKRLGIPGLNYAFIGRPFDYHAASSTPDATDEGSLQHIGDQVLAAARTLASAGSLPAKAPDIVYDDLLGGPIIAYPTWAGWLVLAAGLAISAAAFVRAFRQEQFSALDALRGALALGLASFAAGGLQWLARDLTGIPLGFVQEKALASRWDAYETALAAGGLAAAVLVLKLAALGRTRGWSAWLGALVVGFVLAAALQVAAPLVAFMLAWPLLLAAVLAAVLAFRWGGRLERPSALAFIAVAASPALAQLLYVGHAVALGVGADIPEVLAVFVLTAALFIHPILWPGAGERWPFVVSAAAILLCAGLVVFIRFADPWSVRRPRPTEVFYIADSRSGRFWRSNALSGRDDWSSAVLAADGGAVRRMTMASGGPVSFAAPARPIPAAAPAVSSERTADGRVTLHVAPAAPARQVRIDVKTSGVIDALTINGLAAKPSRRPGQWTHILWDADPAGLTIAFRTPGPVEARWSQLTDGWPMGARPLPPRPADAMPWMDSDSTLLIGAMPPLH
jgi:hypothetical protein